MSTSTAGNARLFDSLKQLLPDEPGAPTQADIAAQLDMSANAVRQAFYRFRQRYQSLLREEIAHTVATPGDVEDELRHLICRRPNVRPDIPPKYGDSHESLSKVRCENPFRRTGRTVHRVRPRNSAWNVSRRCSRWR